MGNPVSSTINNDKKGAKSALHVALNYHSNLISTITQQEKKWWRNIIRIYNLDPDKDYVMDNLRGMVAVRPMNTEEGKKARAADDYGGKG